MPGVLAAVVLLWGGTGHMLWRGEAHVSAALVTCFVSLSHLQAMEVPA